MREKVFIASGHLKGGGKLNVAASLRSVQLNHLLILENLIVCKRHLKAVLSFKCKHVLVYTRHPLTVVLCQKLKVHYEFQKP